MTIVYYRIIDDYNDPEDFYSAETSREVNTDWADWIAEDCAEEYYSNHDGWECDWPLVFAIHAEESLESEIGRFAVDIEAVPSFSASKVRVRPEEMKQESQ